MLPRQRTDAAAELARTGQEPGRFEGAGRRAEFEVDGATEAVERGGAHHGSPSSPADAHVRFAAEHGAAVRVDRVQDRGFVRVHDVDVAVAEAVTVDGEHARGQVHWDWLRHDG